MTCMGYNAQLGTEKESIDILEVARIAIAAQLVSRE